jgi:8-oxo-dGTP diphosphatase
MHLFTADGFEGQLQECNEGVLEWIDKNELLEKDIWQGDKIFLKLLDDNCPFFSLKLVYNGQTLVQAILNGREKLV